MHKRYIISTLIILLMSINTSAFSQKYTTKQVFDSVDSFSNGKIYFSQKGDLFLLLKKRPMYPGRFKLFHSTDNGISWDTLSIPYNDGYNLSYNPKMEAFFYKGYKKDTVLISRDLTKSWQVLMVSKGTFGTWGGKLYFTPDVLDKRGRSINSIKYFVSTNGGVSWDTAYNALPESTISYPNGVACSGGGMPVEDKQGMVYNNFYDGVYYKDSTNKWKRSSYWKKLLSSKKNIYCVQALAIDSNEWLYQGINVLKDKGHKLELNGSNGRWYNSHGFFIVRSKDKGRTWDTLSNFVGAPEEMTTWGRELSQLDFDREGNMIAFTTEGIYRSKDSGKTYQMFDIPKFTYFGCSMTKDSRGNIYIVTTLPDIYGDDDNYGYKLISP
jgi:hypothetical protein